MYDTSYYGGMNDFKLRLFHKIYKSHSYEKPGVDKLVLLQTYNKYKHEYIGTQRHRICLDLSRSSHLSCWECSTAPDAGNF